MLNLMIEHDDRQIKFEIQNDKVAIRLEYYGGWDEEPASCEITLKKDQTLEIFMFLAEAFHFGK